MFTVFISNFLYVMSFLCKNTHKKTSHKQRCKAIPIMVYEKYILFIDSQSIFSPAQLFKMDWLLMSIVLLCIMAMGLYAVINVLEKWCEKRF